MSNSIRPLYLDEYIGQENIVKNLKIYIEASKTRNEILDHCLFYGPPGLGKTSLAKIISNELNTNIKEISAPSIEKVSDIAIILSNLAPGDILFIDEIHRLAKPIEEILYSAMEDYKINIVIGHNSEARQLSINLEPFILIGATTKISLISTPLKNRFPISFGLSYYSITELSKIAKRNFNIYGIDIDDKSSIILAKCSRGTPRILNNLIKRIRDFLTIENLNFLNEKMCLNFLKNLEIDEIGLNKKDREYLTLLYKKFNKGPVGIEPISNLMGEEKNNIENDIEAYLVKINFINRTQRGRVLTKDGENYLKLFIK